MLKKLLKILYLATALSLLSVASIIMIARTQWFKGKLEQRLYDLARANGFSLSIGSLEGSIPLRWNIENAALVSPEGTTIRMDSLRMRIAFFPLLRKELGIGFLKIGKVEVTWKESETNTSSESNLFDILDHFPIDLSIRSLRIDSVAVKTADFSFPPLQIRGILKLKKEGRDLFVKIVLKNLEGGFEQEFFAVGGSRKGQLQLHLKTRLDSLKPLSTLISTAAEIRSLSQIDIQGPWSTWRGLATNQVVASKPLTGEVFLRIDELAIPSYPFLNQPWKCRLSFSLETNRTLGMKKLSLRSSLAELLIEDALFAENHIYKGHYFLKIPSLASFSTIFPQSLDGSLEASGELVKDQFTGNLHIEQGSIGHLHFGQFEGKINLLAIDPLWKGSLHMAIDEKPLHLEGDSELIVDFEKGLNFKNLALSGSSLHVGGDLFIDKHHFLTEGSLHLQSDDFSALEPLFPKKSLAGRVGAEIDFINNGEQSIKAYATLADVEMLHFKITEGTLSLDLHQVDDEFAGSLDLHTERVYFPNVYCASLDVLASGGPSLWNFDVQTRGTWKEPFHLLAKGSWNNDLLSHKILFQELNGTFLGQELRLVDQASLSLSDEALCLEASSLRLGEGELAALYSNDRKNWLFSLQGNSVPLAWLTLFSPYLSLEGESNILCSLQGTDDTVRGSCQVLLKEMMAKRFGVQPIFQAKGTLLANFEGNKMQLHSELRASEGQIVLFDASLPLHILSSSYIPLRLDRDSNYSASLLVEGKLEELSEFANTSFQCWKGWLEGKVLFSGSLNKTLVQGNLAIHCGAYENDFLGLRVENIEAALHASRNEIVLTSLHATGLKNQGALEGKGIIKLDPLNHYPYHFFATLDHLPTIDLDLVESTLTGSVEIDGNNQQAMARGTADVDQAMFSIPRSMPADIPELSVTYVHQPAHVETQLENVHTIFPFGYDLTFHSVDTIHFDAGGLTSRWSGDIHLHGVNINMLASGNLRLNKGQFSLLGKTFQLNHGEITFSDRPGEEGLLNISGTLNMSDVTITAQLLGTLREPQLSLQSVPPLTTTDIFSLLLFNKKVTEIKPMQAVQLARTVMSLSGNSGWNFVGQIGSGLNVLGIDTFDIIPSEQGLDQTSITIGKQLYLIRGVLVSLTQSLSSSRFMVEVDLGGGLIFQAENESGEGQSQQVGKLSLKWNKNY